MVRHGESEGNRDRRFTISSEVPLTELGRRQAYQAAGRIAQKFKPHLIISSPFARARQTSEIIAAELRLPIEIVHELHERDLGALKGHSYDLLREVVRQDPHYDPKRGWLWRPEGGESYEDVRQRVVGAIERLRGDLTTVLIAHRLSTIRWADLIYVIEDGRVVESGDWETLNSRDGRFRALCEAQSLSA